MSKSLRAVQFVERQLTHPSVTARQHMATLQRKVSQDGKAIDDAAFWGARGVDGFRSYLRNRFGSIVAGWRYLDADKNGRLSFYEFCNQCRAMGYHGNLKKLWKELDANNSGFISLFEIDEEVGLTVGNFKLQLMKRYGDMLTAWRKGLDTNNTGRIEEFEVEDCCKRLGIDINPKKLYAMLRSSQGSLGLTLKDFDPDAWNRWVTGDFAGSTMKPNKEFIEDAALVREESLPLDIRSHTTSGGARAFRRLLVERERAENKEIVFKKYRLRLGLHTVPGFREALKRRCGSVLGAWREALDLDGNGRITFGEFCRALHRLGFHGDVKGLFKQLDTRGNGYLLFEDLDKETHTQLTELRDRLCQQYGNMLLAWVKGLDSCGSGCVDETVFVEICEKVGFSNDAKKLFRHMKPEAGRSFLTLKDFDTQAYQALSRGDFRMLSEAKDSSKTGGKRQLDMTFHERQEAGFFTQIRKAWEVARREEFAKACRLANAPERLIDTQEEFEALCKRKFGSMIAAWRKGLDSDHNGKLTFNEFCKAVRKLGYGGDLKVLWAQYDRQNKGFIALEDLDPEAHELVSSFLQLLSMRYGDLDTAWRDCFNKDPHGSIDEGELKEACDILGYTHSAHRLFKCMQTTKGRALITIWDLDPQCTRKRQRGETAILTSPSKSPMGHSGEVALGHTARSFSETPKFSSTGRSTGFGSSGSSQAGYASAVNAGSSTVDACRKALNKTFGSTVAAWRGALDPKNTGAVSFMKFCIVLDQAGFAGKIKCLWQELVQAETALTFQALDPETATILASFRNFLVSKCGSLINAWHQYLDDIDISRVDEDDFLSKLGNDLAKPPPKKVFKLLLARIGQRSITLEDLEALLIGVPLAERSTIWAGPGKETEEPEEPGNGITNRSFGLLSTYSSAGGKMLPPSTAPATEIAPRQRTERMVKDHQAQDRIIVTLDAFKKMLVVKYGSLFAAWRHLLDFDQNGVVTRKDFSNACGKLGVKAVRQLWNELDTNQNDQISLFEIDQDLGEAFVAFQNTLIKRYGSTKEGWRKGFCFDGNVRCHEEQFVSRCQALEYPGDPRKLYKMVRPEPGRPYLTYEDLWLNLNVNDFDVGKEPFQSPLGRTRTRTHLQSEAGRAHEPLAGKLPVR